MEKRYFDFRDIFQVIRYGFSGRKIAVHLGGLVLAYLIYQILVYLSLLVVGNTAAQDFWNNYGLLPVLPFSDAGLTQTTEIAMWIGAASFACIFFLASTMVSKITIEQLRGDFFFSVGNAVTFVKGHWKSVFGAFTGLLLIQVFLVLVPLGIAALGKLPVIGKPFLTISSLFMPLGFFLGVLMALIGVILGVSLLFVPAVVATTGADTFETIYQQFAIVWNQPWRTVCYEGILFLIKLVFVPIWAFFCIVGLSIVMLPMSLLHTGQMEYIAACANLWLGGTIEKLTMLPYINIFGVFNIGTAMKEASAFTTVTAIFFTLTMLMVVGVVIAYLFSIASTGNTMIYSVLRKKIDGHNLLEPFNANVIETPDVAREPEFK